MLIESEHGKTEASARFYIEAEPAIAGIRKRFLAGELDRDSASIALYPLVGSGRRDADFARCESASRPCPKDEDKGLRAMRAFMKLQQDNPMLSRLYGSHSVACEAILSAEGK